MEDLTDSEAADFHTYNQKSATSPAEQSNNTSSKEDAYGTTQRQSSGNPRRKVQSAAAAISTVTMSDVPFCNSDRGNGYRTGQTYCHPQVQAEAVEVKQEDDPAKVDSILLSSH